MALFEKVNEDIKTAMKECDKAALETLRNIRKILPEAKAAPGADDTSEDVDALKIIQKPAKQGKESTQTYIDAGRQDLADAELAQVSAIGRYLPEQLSEAEIEKIVKTIIEQTGAASMKDTGKVTGMASRQLADKADSKTISDIVKKLLVQFLNSISPSEKLTTRTL